MLVGGLLSGAEQSQERDPRMPAYLIVEVARVHDEDTYAAYRERVPAGIREAGGEYLVRGGDVDVLEGDWNPNRCGTASGPARRRHSFTFGAFATVRRTSSYHRPRNAS
jgi:Domain of unknown function (DUF1330)